MNFFPNRKNSLAAGGPGRVSRDAQDMAFVYLSQLADEEEEGLTQAIQRINGVNETTASNTHSDNGTVPGDLGRASAANWPVGPSMVSSPLARPAHTSKRAP